MSHSLESDLRGVIQPCPAGTANRIATPNLDKQGRCGTCKETLPRISEPVVMSGC